MLRKTNFYINGTWTPPMVPNDFDVINPATEAPFCVISLGSSHDVNKAVAAAKNSFEVWNDTPIEERILKIEKLAEIYELRVEEMAKAISMEMGAPIDLAINAQAAAGLGHIKSFIRVLREFKFEHRLRDNTPDEFLIHEPVGVCGLITPWNWPMNQVTMKVVPALGVGCTVVLKPSEIAPMSSLLFAEFMEEAGFLNGVFNLVNGDGPTVGEAIGSHPDVDMISFTGSTKVGIALTRSSANTVKRVALEMGGKGANIIFADANIPEAVKRGAIHCFNNTGQSCNAPTRMLVERSVYDKALEIASATAKSTAVGQPNEHGTHIGPLVSETQFNKVQGLIQSGIDEGARLIAGGIGRPDGFNIGYFVQATVFADVDNAMRIAREEIFGPVLSIMPFDNEEEAVRISNDTRYGLTNYVQSGDIARAQRIARRLRSGMVVVNGASRHSESPFGGYKQSGKGREGGIYGLEEFLEIKAVSGWNTPIL
ncbi:aldehyde dehydrogenase family protein [Candidatus Endolissoclinum faulkneri L5]|uniref:aldehyde dehydrogenase (NAD(+)) n=1 Tax=Candidatus Endolissoclinum faulkneri L5 TaxID=1401328 RepID=V9TVW9_9PROT|nr:aldehyde dehydrogenase family protein [Candidatus Endolissoclinum faulkneri]AHC73848.1 aldehyde dehydrogenase family protein [Candidatus Endolissoclinum faulkneri L5]